ncbi:MAG: hypothetical protein WC444_06115 [Candidatus Paceibacterota bacterium]
MDRRNHPRGKVLLTGPSERTKENEKKLSHMRRYDFRKRKYDNKTYEQIIAYDKELIESQKQIRIGIGINTMTIPLTPEMALLLQKDRAVFEALVQKATSNLFKSISLDPDWKNQCKIESEGIKHAYINRIKEIYETDYKGFVSPEIALRLLKSTHSELFRFSPGFEEIFS